MSRRVRHDLRLFWLAKRVPLVSIGVVWAHFKTAFRNPLSPDIRTCWTPSDRSLLALCPRFNEWCVTKLLAWSSFRNMMGYDCCANWSLLPSILFRWWDACESDRKMQFSLGGREFEISNANGVQDYILPFLLTSRCAERHGWPFSHLEKLSSFENLLFKRSL